VVEMDAASNNSVDDIRELRENVALAPMEGGSRVYILDEAHMLTQQAWNAFLKTLEEPPSYVVFVLATTEAHKVPATIIDRCHRFDFGRPSLEQIAGVLQRVAAEEKIEVPDPAIGMIARSATGSFRDALGTLEQLVTYGGKTVELGDVLEVLGVADAELVLDAAEALVERDPKRALAGVGRLSDSGRDFTQFMRDLSGHLRHLLVVQVTGELPDSFAVTAAHPDRLQAQAERASQGELARTLEFLAAAIAAVKDGSDPRIQLELALLKATQPQADLSLQALMFRIEQLERRIEGGSAPQAPPATRGSAPEAAASAPGPSGEPPARAAAGGGPAAQAVVEPAEQALEAPDLELERVVALWPAVRDAVCERNQMVGALLADARPTDLDAGRLTVSFPTAAAFSKKKAEANRELVERALRGLLGQGLVLRYELSEDLVVEGARPPLSEEELIERLRAEFGAEEVFEDEVPD